MGGFSIPDSQSLAYHHSGFQNFTERDSVDKERVHAVAQKALLEQVSLALEHGGASELLTLLRSVADPSFRFDRCFEQITTKEQVRELFELVHFDSLAGDGPAGFVRSSHTLAVASQLLSFFARRHDLNEKQRAELDRLQRGFLFASNLQQYSSYSPDQTVMAHRLKAYKTAVLQELAEKGEVVLAAGWKGSPGHFVLMELHCREGRVSGSITNSGSGVDFHLLARVEGHKIKQGNTLYLKETSLDALSSSPFLHLVWNLWTFHELSNSKEDFYHTVLCHWPGDIKLGDSYGIYHSKQSGPTCTFRPLQQVAKDILGPVLGRLYKLYVQIATLLPRLSILGEQPTLQEIDQLIYATSQIARRVYRMATAGLLPGSQERGLMELCKSIRQSLLDRRSEYLDQVRFRRCSLKMLASDLEPIEKEPPAPMIQSAPAFEWPSLRLEQTRDAFMENAKNVQALSAQQNQQDAADLAIETLLNLPPQVLQEPTEEEFEALLFLFEAEYLQIQGDAGAPRLSVRRGLALLMGFVASLNYCAQQPNGASFAGFHRYLLNLHLSQGNQLRRMKHPKDLAVYERLMSELKRVPYEEGMATTIVRYTNPGMLVFKWLGSDLGKLLQKQGELASMNALADLNAFGFGMQSLPIWYKLVVYQGYLLYALCFARLKQLFKLGPLKVGQNLSQAGSQAIFTTEIYGSFLGYGKGAETSLSILDEGSDVKFLNSESIQKARCAHSFNFHSDVLSGVGGCEGMKGMTEAQTEEFSLISMDPALLVPRWAQFVERYPMLLNSRVPCYHIEATLFVPHFGEYPIDDLSQAPLFHDAIARVLKVCQNERWKDAALALVRMQTQVLRRQLELNGEKSVLKPAIEGLEQTMQELMTVDDGVTFMLGGLLRYCDHPSLAKIRDFAEACALKELVSVPASLETPERRDDYSAAILGSAAPPSSERGLIPRAITRNADYIFSQSHPAVKKGDRYYFSVDGQSYYVARRFGGLDIARLVDDVWMPLLKNRGEYKIPHQHPLKSRLFADSLMWQGPDGVLITSSDTLEPLFRIKDGVVFRGSSDQRLVTTDHVLAQHLKGFAGKWSGDLLMWADPDDTVVKIEIPSLDFGLDWKEGDWVWAQNPEYHLDSRYALSDFDTVDHYLVVKDGSGRRMALVPNRVFDRDSGGLEPDLEDLRVYRYNIRNDGAVVIPTERPAAFYLAYLALLRKDYRFGWKVARHLLRNRAGIKVALDPATKREISRIIQWTAKDKHPHACAIRCAFCLVLQGEAIENKWFDNEELKRGIKESVETYIHHQNKCPDFPLSVSALTKLASQCDGDWRNLNTAPERPVFHLGADFSWIRGPAKPGDRLYNWMDEPRDASLPTEIIDPDPYWFLNNFPYYYRMAWERNKDFAPILDLIIQGTRFSCVPSIRSAMTVLYLTREGKINCTPEEMQKWAREGSLESRLQRMVEPYAHRRVLSFPSIQEKVGASTMRTSEVERDALLRPPSLIPATFSLEPISVKSTLSTRLQKESFIRPINEQEIQRQQSQLASKCAQIKERVYSIQRSEPCEAREVQLMADALEAYAAQWKPRVPLQSCIQTEADAVRAMDCIDQEMTSQGVMTLAAENEVGALLRGLSIRDQGAVEAELRQDWTLRSLILQLAQGTMPEVPHGLIDAVFRFLIHETEAQLAARAIQKLRHLMDRGNQIGFDHAECKDLAQDFASELKPRAYELRCDLETLQCLCFEWLSDKRLFVDQYEKLNTLDGNALLEFQAPTGSGKSSTIFPLLLWLVITRKSRELTVMTVRDSQLEDQLKLLRTLLGDAFDTAIQPFVVDREVLSRKAGIKRAKEVVTDAREERRIILTTPRSLHACLFLSPVEVADDRLLFESLAELRSLLTEGAIHFIDESKEVFDVSKSYTYSLGAPEPIDRETRKGVFSVYSQLVLNKALHSEWNFDFLAAYTAGKGKGITPENYAELRDTLIQRAPEALCSWLSGEPGLPEGIADHTYYTHLRYLLHQSFSVLLTSKYKVGYRRKRDLTAEPLEEGKPFPGMEFANPIQAVAFTVQANLAEPYTSSDLQPYVEAVKELLRSGNLRHPLARFWSEQIAPQIPQLPPPAELEDCAPLCELLNDPNRLELRLAFIQLYVLQHVVFSKEKIDSNPHIHIQALKRAIAASGTTRPETLPPQVESWRALDGVIHTLLRLWEGSQDKVTELVGAHAREKLQSVLAEPHHRVLIDAAGEFLKLDIQAIADEVFVSRPEAQALVYYNDEGQLLALLRDGGESIPHHSCALEEKHLYYMLHRRYAIGADLPLPMDIQGFVTVDRLCDTALLVQAVGRLRHLGRGQVAHIGVASEDCNAILSNLGRKESKPRLTDILLWAAIVEGQDKGRQFYQALGAFLSAHESEVFWDLATPWTRALPSLRALLTRKVSSSVQSRENEDLHLQPAKDVVESLLEERLGIWKDCGAENSKLCSGEFIEAYRSYADLTKLPAYLPLGQAEPGRCVTTQQEGVAQKYGHAQQVGLEDAQRSAWNLQRVKMHYRGGSHREWIESSDVLDLGDCEVRFSPRALGVAVAWGGCTDVEAVCPEFVVRRNRRDGTISVLALGAEDSPDVVCKMKNANSVPAEDFDYYLLNASGCVAADAAVPYEVVKKELEGNGTLALAMKLLSGNHLLSGKEEELWMQLRRESPKFLEHLRKVAPLRPKLRRLLEL